MNMPSINFRIATIVLVTIAMALMPVAKINAALNSSSPAAQPVSVKTPDGQLICNTSGAFSQIPGQVDLFVGRGYGIGSLDYCHKLRNASGFLAIFRMDWKDHSLLFENYLLKPPLRTSSGVDLHNAYDPYVALYRGEVWVAFECTVPGAVSSCIAPLARDMRSLDLSRLTVAAEGTLGPHGPSRQIVGLLSASAPTLLNYADKLYLYWQIDAFDNDRPENGLVTRGMQLAEDAKGRLWGVGSGGRPVRTDDPRLTALVHDADAVDQTRNHVAVTSDLVVVGGKILEIASIGGTGGKQVCRSTHDISPGCWRVSLSVAGSPLGQNVFGKHALAGTGLPANGIEYPRVIADPAGHRFLFGYFFQPKTDPLAEGRVMYDNRGLEYVPFDPAAFVH